MFQETEAFSSIQLAEFTGFIKSNILTVVMLMPNHRIVRGMNISGANANVAANVAANTVIVGEVATPGIFGTSTPKGGPGRYVVSVRQTVGTSAAPIPMRGTLVSGGRMPEPITPGSSLMPGPSGVRVGGSGLPPLPTTNALYPLTQTNPPGVTPSTLAQIGFSWPLKVKPFVQPPPPSGSGLPPLPTTNALYPLTQTNPPQVTPSTLAQIGFSWPLKVKPFVQPPPPSGSGLPPLPTTHPLYPLTQTNPPGVTPSTLAMAGFSWPLKPYVQLPPQLEPPPPSGGGGPASTDHKEMLAFLQNENRTNMSELERLRAEFSKSQSIQSTELAVIRAVDRYITNMSLYRDDITQDLDKKVIPNLQTYRRVNGGREGQVGNLRLLIEAMNNRMELYNKLAEDIQNGSGITVARIKEEIASADSLVTKYVSAYNATGRVDEQPVSQQVFAVRIQRPLPLLEFPPVAGTGSSTNIPAKFVLTRSRNPALYDQIVANPNPAIWEPILKAYNPPFLFPTDLPTTTTTLPTTTSTLRSISGFSDYKGKIASWTESFAPFEN